MKLCPVFRIPRIKFPSDSLNIQPFHVILWLDGVCCVNAQIKDDTALGQLMHDFWCTGSDEMHYTVPADRVRYFKEDTKGVASMCRAMEEMRNEAAR